jgi:small nuclear ribonucleoprotein (snRNP)-like protein
MNHQETTQRKRGKVTMRKTTMFDLGGVALAILVSLALLTVPVRAAAQTKAIEGVKFEVSQSLNDNLKPFVGKLVYVNLRSGKIYQGSLKAVGDHWIHLEKVAERTFYDALIRIDDISAIEAQFRDNK